MDVVREGFSTLRDEGVRAFLHQASRYLSWQLIPLRARIALRKGELSLSVDGTTARFTATNTESIHRTLRRFHSEQERIRDIMTVLHEDDVFYDIGANTGLYTCFAARRCETVIAFEPYPPNLSELEENSQLNDGNITVLDVALSNKSDTIGFVVDDENWGGAGTGGAGFGKGSIDEDEGDLEVSTVIGDDLIEQGEIPKPTVVKIDVEGAEPLVIEGLRNGLSQDSCRLVFCEVHRPSGSRGSIQDHGVTESKMRGMFEDLGFDTTIFSDEGSEFVIRAQRS